jgi:phospholipid/cholesterol/gamma-HCH transport system substrate-binding protein
MTRSMIETLLGALVLVVAGYFLFFSYTTADVGGSGADGYNIYADFAGVGGLKAGDPVQISGVKVGKVSAVELAPETYLARVHIALNSKVQLPADTAALISSESLLGGRYLSLEPGADEEMLKPGSRIQYTQAPQNLEQLLGQFIFSMQGDKKDEKSSDASVPAPAPSEAVPHAPVDVEEQPPAAAQPEAPAEEAQPAHP